MPLATGSSSCLPSLISLAASSISLFLPLVFLLEFFGWSSGPSVAFCGLFVLCSLVGSSPGGPFFSCLRFQLLVFGGSGWSPSCFLFEPYCIPFFPLGASCDVGVPCMPSASLLSVGFLVALSVFCVQCSFFLLSRFHGYLARPASVSPRCRSLFLSPRAPFHSLSRPFCAVPRGIFSYTASSSSSALPLLCLSVGASWYVCS